MNASRNAYRVVRAWGFTPKSLLTWCKPGPGMGYYLRNNTEHVIFATRGKPMVPETKAMSSWYEWPRLRHSEKPQQFYDLAETVSPGPRLDMFARVQRNGWHSWGDEAPGAVMLEGFHKAIHPPHPQVSIRISPVPDRQGCDVVNRHRSVVALRLPAVVGGPLVHRRPRGVSHNRPIGGHGSCSCSVSPSSGEPPLA